MSKEFFSSGNSHNTIAHGTSIHGDITAEADIRIDGVIIGNVNCVGKIIIGIKGSITGDVTADSADIMGNLHGNIQVKDSLSIKSTAQIYGNVEMNTLSVEPHAVLTGYCTMISSKK